MDVQAEEAARTERIELEGLQLGGGLGVRVEERTRRLGSFVAGQDKPSPKLDRKTGNYFVGKKQFTSWCVINSCEDALMETSNPMVFQGPNYVSNEELVFSHGAGRVAAGRGAYEDVINAIYNHYLQGRENLPRKNRRSRHGGGAPDVRTKRRPDEQAYLRKYINAAMVDAEKPECTLNACTSSRKKWRK